MRPCRSSSSRAFAYCIARSTLRVSAIRLCRQCPTPDVARAEEANHLPLGGVGRAGYLGPCPPPGSGQHHYVFTLYALGDKTLRIPDNPLPDMVSVAAKSSALGEATVTYTFGR